MIRREEITEIGKFGKPHGINGELTAVVVPEIEVEDIDIVISEIDGIFVPFFPTSIRRRGNEGVLVMLDGIEDEKHARMLVNKGIFVLTSHLPESFGEREEDGFYASDFIEWTIKDSETVLGTIVDFDDSTENLLFIVESEGKRIYIPVADEFIVDIDEDNRVIEMALPEGITDL